MLASKTISSLLLGLNTSRLVGRVWTNNKNNGNDNNNNNIHEGKYLTINTTCQSFNIYDVYSSRGCDSRHNHEAPLPSSLKREMCHYISLNDRSSRKNPLVSVNTK